jgi:nucleoside-diphosphate-sugar epimerase
MRKIFISGHNGFVGKNLLIKLTDKFKIIKYVKNSNINIDADIVINLAGKAHDLRNTTNSDEYYRVNFEFTKCIYNEFLNSNATIFISFSSVKAAADHIDQILTEDYSPNPITHYGKSKLLAEKYILTKNIPFNKRVYILRPCMIHGPGNKGNLNLLYNIVSKGIPWPLGAYENYRSFCSIDNLSFIIQELIEAENIPSGIYNIADDDIVSTNELIKLIAATQNKKATIWKVPKFIINYIAKIGDLLYLPLNTERLNKLTENYIVSNEKIKKVINKKLPVSSKEGLNKTFISFYKNI